MRGCFADWLHQPYREAGNPGLVEVITAATEAGALGGFLSGSGSTIACVSTEEGVPLQRIAEAMRKAYSIIGEVRLIITEADNTGAETVEVSNQAWKETLEGLEEYATEVIYDRKQGYSASLLRVLLRGLSGIWSLGVKTRLFLYRKRILREHNLGCLVISIGNITVGGTGKTPVVELFATALRDAGRSVAILSRGYKSERPSLWQRLKSRVTGKTLILPPRTVSDGRKVLLDSRTSGDEPYMLAANLKGVVVLVDKDRVKAGAWAIRKHATDTLLLDDGLQYLRLKHRLDIVLVDRTAPFGTGHLLPRGTLREPATSLRRAHYIFVTKCARGEPNDDVIKAIRKYNQTAEIIECRHAPRYLQNAFSQERLPTRSPARPTDRHHVRHRHAGEL